MLSRALAYIDRKVSFERCPTARKEINKFMSKEKSCCLSLNLIYDEKKNRIYIIVIDIVA